MFGYHGHGGAGTYWRRRLAVLCAGLGVLAAITWAASGAISARAGIGHGWGVAGQSAGNAAAGSDPGHGPDAAAGSGSGHAGQPGGPAASQGPGRPSGAQARPATSGQSPAAAHPKPSASPSAGKGVLPGYCSRKDIVLSLFASQASFAPGQRPSFSINVVSTGPADCSFNLGPGYLALVIKEGPVTIWNSADCVSGTGALLSALKRGVPTVLAMTWNRRTSSPGCSGPVTQAPPGVYTAHAEQGSLTSTPVSFRLG